MKFLTLATAILIAIGGINAQEKKARKSPMKTTEAMVGKSKVTITYSSPSVKGRTIFGDLVPFDKVWRTGANEATILETSSEIQIGGNKLPAGKYGVFTIPSKDSWTIIINSVWDQWGAYKYDEGKDVFRATTSKVQKIDSMEQFAISVAGGELSFEWSTTKASIPIK